MNRLSLASGFKVPSKRPGQLRPKNAEIGGVAQRFGTRMDVPRRQVSTSGIEFHHFTFYGASQHRLFRRFVIPALSRTPRARLAAQRPELTVVSYMHKNE